MTSRSSIVIALSLVCFACESKPLKPVEGKLTPPNSATATPRSEFEVKTLESPSQDQRVEAAIILSSGIQDCLRQGLKQNTEIVVEISGKLSAGGKFTVVQVSQADDPLQGCLLTEVKKTAVEPGAAGRFRVRLTHVVDGKPGTKTILLDKKAPKKFQ